jgi:hypothetical protein
MTTQPLFYKNVVPLNKEKHGKLSLAPIDNYNHTRDTNSVYIAAIEFPKAAKEYPIVFAKAAGDEIFPVVLLGLKDKENLFLDKKGEWLANYIPAYVRRYPFILASGANQGDNEFAVCIDDGYEGFNTKKKGIKLFEDDGKESELLQNALKFLKEYQNHIRFTRSFCKSLDELGLLEPMQAKAEFKDGKTMALRGFMGISRDKLKALDPARLAEMVKENYMDLVYAHLNSLDNMQNLIKKLH